MGLATWAPLGLATMGVAKAGAIVWAGSKFGAPDWVVALTAALWVTGPATVAWLYADRQKRLAGRGTRPASRAAPGR
jgi:hypothetical protein